MVSLRSSPLCSVSVCHPLFHHPVLPGGTKAAQVHHQPEMRLCEYRGQQRLGDLPLQLQNVVAEMAKRVERMKMLHLMNIVLSPRLARQCQGMLRDDQTVGLWCDRLIPCPALYTVQCHLGVPTVTSVGRRRRRRGSQLPFLQRSLRMRGCT